MLIIIVPTIISQLLTVYLFYQRHWYNVSLHTSGFLVTEISSLIRSEEYLHHPHRKHTYFNLEYIFTPNSKAPKLKTESNEEFEIFKTILKEKTNKEAIISFDDDSRVKLYLQLGSDLLEIRLPYKSLLNPSTDIFILLSLILTVLLTFISLVFSRNQIKSILELSNAAENYGIGNKSYIYKPTGAKEIRRTGLSFLKMKDRIERQATKRTQMLAMISHDLKTPLTRMKLQVELMDNGEEKEELSHDINSMQQMISSYLDFARGEGGETFQESDLNKWLEKYIQDKWGSTNISLLLNKNKILTQIKPHSFARAIDNLISNSLKYSSKIIISTSLRENEIALTIEDNGKGIDKKERNLVFKPFYRADKSRSLDNVASVGLGLAITKEIINGHFGSITLGKSKKLNGLSAKIILPRKKSTK
jgi:two-component system osmolarity sensor histidine kinase EnvZ